MNNAIGQFRRQHRREPQFFGVVDRKTQQLIHRAKTQRAAEMRAKRENLLTEHEMAYCLEDSVMLGYFFCNPR